MGTNEQTLSSFSFVEVVFSAWSVCVFAGWLCLSTWMEEDEKTQLTFGADPDKVTDQHFHSFLRDYCMDLDGNNHIESYNHKAYLDGWYL